MAKTSSLCRRNSKLETFLKRNTARDVYERIRAYEPCVVVSETVNKAFMHVVLSDDCVYLTEYPPRTLQPAVRFRHIINIVMINDLPDFLRGREREQSLHICVVYASAKDSGKREQLLPPSLNGNWTDCSSTRLAPPEGDDWGLHAPLKRDDRGSSARAIKCRSTSCPPCPDRLVWGAAPVLKPRPLTSGEPRLQGQPSTATPSGRPQDLLIGQADEEDDQGVGGGGAGGGASSRSTLMLDPLYMKKCNKSPSASPWKQKQPENSSAQTSRLFQQLRAELVQERLAVKRLHLLLQELHTAAHHHTAVRTLFWKSAELYPLLVHTLVENSTISQDRPHTTDRLELCTLLVETLSLMFCEAESEPACQSVVTFKQGTVMTSMLRAVLWDPDLHLHDTPSLQHNQITSYKELQALQAEYRDAASVLVFEVLLFCQDASHTPSPGHSLTVGWMFTTLQSHSSFVAFVGYQAQQVALALMPSHCPLSPSQAVLLYQRCSVLLACIQNSATLRAYITTEFREEFRYYVGLTGLEDKLPPHYPISTPTLHHLTTLHVQMCHQPVTMDYKHCLQPYP